MSNINFKTSLFLYLLIITSPLLSLCIQWKPKEIDTNLFCEESTVNHNTDYSTVLIFSHGFSCHHGCGGGLISKLDNKNIPCFSFDYPDVQEGIKQTSFGQENEIAILKNTINQIRQRYKNVRIIIYGVSRGASTIITTLATLNDQELNAIAAVILESPFDHIRSVIASIFNKTFILSYATGLGLKVMERIAGKFDSQGISPLTSAAHIQRKDIPMLIVCSRQDLLVTWESSTHLYQQLVRDGHTEAHLLVLPEGRHGALCSNQAFCGVLHTFYQHYNLPYNTEHAQACSLDFATLKPTDQVIEKWEKAYKRGAFEGFCSAFKFMKRIIQKALS